MTARDWIGDPSLTREEKLARFAALIPEPTAPPRSTCASCGLAIEERYSGTFWKAPDPMPVTWFHVHNGDRSCGYARPVPDCGCPS